MIFRRRGVKVWSCPPPPATSENQGIGVKIGQKKLSKVLMTIVKLFLQFTTFRTMPIAGKSVFEFLLPPWFKAHPPSPFNRPSETWQFYGASRVQA